MHRLFRFGSSRKNIPFVVVVFLASVAFSQASNPQRPRLGLALSGGGALGLAHVGVLQYFEEHQIPIGAVAGTSMGGLVGGFYATGLNSKELENVALTANFDRLLSTNPEYEDRPVAEK